MSVTRLLAILAITWLVIGFTIAYIMRRRGHDFWVWLTLGAVLGPFAVPLAVERARYHLIEYTSNARPIPDGPLDLLVGLDGSAESDAALDTAMRLLSGRVSSVTLVKVLDLDSGGEYTGSDAQSEAEALLKSAADRVVSTPVSTRVLFGRPDRAMLEYAVEEGIEMIVVGARGHGASKALFGSVTGQLVGESTVPVFVGPSVRV